MSNECLDAVLAELNAAGITPTIEHGGKHILVRWQHNSHPRIATVPATASDWRSPMNARRDVRKILRADDVLPADDTPAVIEMPRLVLRAGKPVVSSIDVARHFDKQHKNVLRDINRIINEVGEEFGRLNFEPTSYVDDMKREYRCFDLTRDGFSFLVMGFTGAAAAKWKVAYIDAFNAMEAEIFRPPEVAQDAALVQRLARLEGELNALIDLSLVSQPKVRRGIFIRPSVRRQLLELAR